MKSNSANYYNLLGVPSTASPAEITQAYHKRILAVHVDKLESNENSDLCYQTIEAYRILSNHDSRSKYDIQRDTESRALTDRELIEKYKPDQPMTPSLIAELRSRHNLVLLANRATEAFVPTGAICYEVEDQLSKEILGQIHGWQNEFRDGASTESSGLRDNYFHCYARLMDSVLEPEPVPTLKYACQLCDRKFLNEKHHDEAVLQSYIDWYYTDAEGSHTVPGLYDFFETRLGHLFTWEPGYLPNQPLGIWARPEWDNLPAIIEEMREVVSELPPASTFDTVEEHMTYLRIWVYAPAAEFMCWVLLNPGRGQISAKAQELLSDYNVEDLLVFISVVSEFLGLEDWEELRSQALANEEAELGVLWTKVCVLLGFHSRDVWIEVGMRLHKNKDDPYLSHFCFIFGSPDWDAIGDEFTDCGDHLSAITYHMFPGRKNLSCVLKKYGKLIEKDRAGARVYRTVYYSYKVKSLLQGMLYDRKADDLEELIGIVELLFPDPIEPFKLIVRTFEEFFKEPAFNTIHQRVIEHLQSQWVTFSSLNLMLAGEHFLVAGDNQLHYISEHFSELTKSKLESNLNTCNFEGFTDVLLKLNKWNRSAAEEVLEELDTNPGNHIESMKLLLRGTIHKLCGDWLAAATDYQTALLNSPECLYRLTPCVSRLTQDIEFHEGILAQVQGKVRQLKSRFEAGSYIEMESLPQDSLVLGHVSPQSEFGYKDLTGRIQTVDRPKDPVPGPAPDEPAPVETNTPLLTMDKVERAIEVGVGPQAEGPLDGLNAGLAYLDLLKALPMALHHGPLVMAASHFLRAMEEKTEPGSLYALRKAILDMAGRLLQLDRNLESRVQSCLTHKHMFSIVLAANQRLAQSAKESGLGPGVDLISEAESELLERLLRSVVGFSKVEPLLNIPTLSCSDLNYVERVKTHFLHQFCRDKVRERVQSSQIPPHIHAQTMFMEARHGRCGQVDFETERANAMAAFLADQGWKFKDMERFMEWTPIDSEGWTNEGSLAGFGSIDGFKMDLLSGQISFLLSRGSIFSVKDVYDVFEHGLDSTSLSLRIPSQDLGSNPCKEVQYQPDSLAGTQYLQCLLRTSMLLNSFATGVEVSSYPPFSTKLIDQGFLNQLPEHLQYFLRSIKERSADSLKKPLQAYQFSINLNECFEEIEEAESEFLYKVGQVRAEVVSLKSECPSSEAFARDFTKNYEEVSKYIPEFIQLKELKKVSVIYMKLREILWETTRKLLETELEVQENTRLSNVSTSIQSLGIRIEDANNNRDNDRPVRKFGRGWVPSTSCHSEYADPFEVTGGVRIEGTPQYGPVSPSVNSSFISTFALKAELDNLALAHQHGAHHYVTATVYVRSTSTNDSEQSGLQNKDGLFNSMESLHSDNDSGDSASETGTKEPSQISSLLEEESTEPSGRESESEDTSDDNEDYSDEEDLVLEPDATNYAYGFSFFAENPETGESRSVQDAENAETDESRSVQYAENAETGESGSVQDAETCDEDIGVDSDLESEYSDAEISSSSSIPLPCRETRFGSIDSEVITWESCDVLNDSECSSSIQESSGLENDKPHNNETGTDNSHIASESESRDLSLKGNTTVKDKVPPKYCEYIVEEPSSDDNYDTDTETELETDSEYSDTEDNVETGSNDHPDTIRRSSTIVAQSAADEGESGSESEYSSADLEGLELSRNQNIPTQNVVDNENAGLGPSVHTENETQDSETSKNSDDSENSHSEAAKLEPQQKGTITKINEGNNEETDNSTIVVSVNGINEECGQFGEDFDLSMLNYEPADVNEINCSEIIQDGTLIEDQSDRDNDIETVDDSICENDDTESSDDAQSDETSESVQCDEGVIELIAELSTAGNDNGVQALSERASERSSTCQDVNANESSSISLNVKPEQEPQRISNDVREESHGVITAVNDSSTSDSDYSDRDSDEG